MNSETRINKLSKNAAQYSQRTENMKETGNRKIVTYLLTWVSEMNERKDVEEIFEMIMVETFPDIRDMELQI